MISTFLGIFWCAWLSLDCSNSTSPLLPIFVASTREFLFNILYTEPPLSEHNHCMSPGCISYSHSLALMDISICYALHALCTTSAHFGMHYLTCSCARCSPVYTPSTHALALTALCALMRYPLVCASYCHAPSCAPNLHRLLPQPYLLSRLMPTFLTLVSVSTHTHTVALDLVQDLKPSLGIGLYGLKLWHLSYRQKKKSYNFLHAK